MKAVLFESHSRVCCHGSLTNWTQAAQTKFLILAYISLSIMPSSGSGRRDGGPHTHAKIRLFVDNIHEILQAI